MLNSTITPNRCTNIKHFKFFGPEKLLTGGYILFKGKMSNYLSKLKIKDNDNVNDEAMILLLVIPLIFLFFISFIIGRYPIYPQEIVLAIASKILHNPSMSSPAINTIIFDIRLPRILAAMMVGGALSLAGASFRANPEIHWFHRIN